MCPFEALSNWLILGRLGDCGGDFYTLLRFLVVEPAGGHRTRGNSTP